MERCIIIEIGSTNTKAYLYENDKIEIIKERTIEFKNHYKKEQKIADSDKDELFYFINSIKEKNTYVFGTSIFRNLTEKQQKEWLVEFKKNTNLDFTIVTPDMENEFTVYGAVANIDYRGKVAVMIGGGDSTELSIIENKQIIEKANSSFGAIDVTDMFPELRTDFVTSDYEHMLKETKKLVNTPKNKADLLILAGGDYLYYYKELNYSLDKNKFYKSPLQPFCLDIKAMDILDKKFFYETSLEEICTRTNKDGWWRGARGMRLCVKALVDILNVKYIIPTHITMVYGIVEKIKNNTL